MSQHFRILLRSLRAFDQNYRKDRRNEDKHATCCNKNFLKIVVTLSRYRFFACHESVALIAFGYEFRISDAVFVGFDFNVDGVHDIAFFVQHFDVEVNVAVACRKRNSDGEIVFALINFSVFFNCDFKAENVFLLLGELPFDDAGVGDFCNHESKLAVRVVVEAGDDDARFFIDDGGVVVVGNDQLADVFRTEARRFGGYCDKFEVCGFQSEVVRRKGYVERARAVRLLVGAAEEERARHVAEARIVHLNRNSVFEEVIDQLISGYSLKVGRVALHGAGFRSRDVNLFLCYFNAAVAFAVSGAVCKSVAVLCGGGADENIFTRIKLIGHRNHLVAEL